MNNGVKKTFKVLLRILLVFVIILVIAVIALAGTYFFINCQKDVQDKESRDKNIIYRLVVPEKKEEPVVTCLFLGVNGNLTDFIMLGQYNPNTREIALLSIPRDTNVGNNSVDGKINPDCCDEKGCIEFYTNSISRAIAWFERNNVEFRYESSKTYGVGIPISIYLKEKIKGFTLRVVEI